ncbi:YflJ family protein [Halalkalibacter wakoensis]|uniref:YflJ family protein n=1 Tax=Halalkalibacter wakoensis TaxID=127891 RepID=UPI0004BB7874|nr:YflJ family protein [Halalkalibacter wakoensis]
MLVFAFTMQKGLINMYTGSKGWYVKKLKEQGVRYIEDRKIEQFKTHVLANLLEETQSK